MAGPDWKIYRALFPAVERRAYFGWASVAPLSTRVVEACSAHLAGVRDEGALIYRDWYATYDAVRDAAAKILNARAPDEIALLKNTSEGVSTIAFGLPLSAGDNVVLPLGEFPANAYPWLALEARGIEVRRVPISPEGRYTADDIAARIDRRTRVVALSFVNYATGFRADLARIGKLCRGAGAFFFVDAIQGLGVFPLDVEAMCIDGLAADGHKWLCGPEGFALLYVRNNWIEKIRPISLGWWSVETPGRYDLDRQPLAEGARRFECGTLTTCAAYGLRAALELVLEVGVENISLRVEELSAQLADGLRLGGCKLARAEGAGETSGIVAFGVPGKDARELALKLEARGVFVNPRGGRLRAAVHAWNNAADVSRLLDALAEECR